MLLLGQLYTDDTNVNNNGDANNDDNDTRWTNRDCIGSLACMANEPKSRGNDYFLAWQWIDFFVSRLLSMRSLVSTGHL